MTDDTGFAPNPFFGMLSLATCKPLIREKKKKGDFVAGFTSKALCNEKMGEERLVFIMKITDKLNYAQYFDDKRFNCKKPSSGTRISQSGDNIYFQRKGKYEQALTYHHRNREMQYHDLTSDKVLLSDEFYYFGSGAIPIDHFKINIPKTQSAHGVRTIDEKQINRLWEYLTINFKRNILIAPPHSWKVDEPYNTRQNGCC